MRFDSGSGNGNGSDNDNDSGSNMNARLVSQQTAGKTCLNFNTAYIVRFSLFNDDSKSIIAAMTIETR
jgi:hypothetical protein